MNYFSITKPLQSVGNTQSITYYPSSIGISKTVSNYSPNEFTLLKKQYYSSLEERDIYFPFNLSKFEQALYWYIKSIDSNVIISDEIERIIDEIIKSDKPIHPNYYEEDLFKHVCYHLRNFQVNKRFSLE